MSSQPSIDVNRESSQHLSEMTVVPGALRTGGQSKQPDNPISVRRLRRTRKDAAALEPIGHSISEVSAITGLSNGKLYLDIGKGLLKAHKAGNRTLVLHSDLLEYLQSLPLKTGPSELHRTRVQQRYAGRTATALRAAR